MSVRPEYRERYLIPDAELPYGVTPNDFRGAIKDTY